MKRECRWLVQAAPSHVLNSWRRRWVEHQHSSLSLLPDFRWNISSCLTLLLPRHPYNNRLDPETLSQKQHLSCIFSYFTTEEGSGLYSHFITTFLQISSHQYKNSFVCLQDLIMPGWSWTCNTAKGDPEFLILFFHFSSAGITGVHHYA